MSVTTRSTFESAAVSMEQASLATLPPELVSEFPNYLPIVCRPAALISLALVCRSLCDIIIPDMLYRAVWLEGEGRALTVLIRFNTQLGRGQQFSWHIRHLAIVSESKSKREDPTIVLQELRKLISAGGLQNLVALSLHLGGGWFTSGDPVHGPAWLGRPFWEELAKNCPMIIHVHLTGITEYARHKWVANSEIFDFKALKTLRMMDHGLLGCSLINLPSLISINSKSKTSMEVLELPVLAHFKDLISVHFSNLRTLILDRCYSTYDASVPQFWKNHDKLERIELDIIGGSFFAEATPSWLPNLQTLRCIFFHAKALLPYVHSRLINFTLIDAVNAQALYLLRVIIPTGTMTQLRSLGIQVTSSRHASDVTLEGNRWYEDGEGHVSEVSKRKAMRYLDANYLATLAKAVPNLEELELIGHSDGSIYELTSSLQRFHRLHTLVISGAADLQTPSFFHSSVNWPQYVDTDAQQFDHLGVYVPLSLEEAVSDLANGCRTLQQIHFGSQLGQLCHPTDVTATIVRDGIAGLVSAMRVTKGWGRLIGREDDW